jgi:hypothetical protein
MEKVADDEAHAAAAATTTSQSQPALFSTGVDNATRHDSCCSVRTKRKQE